MSGVQLQAALAYAARGWRVVPSWTVVGGGACECPRGVGCPAAGKHPRVRGWQDEATTDPDRVREWWGLWPQANISIVTGQESGLFVVDVDGERGATSLEAWERGSRFGAPATMTAATGGGGRHLFYQWPAGQEDVVVRNRSGWLPGVDVRGEGGQVVAPPSPHASGAFYTWASGWEEGPAEAPEELVRAVVSTSGGAMTGGATLGTTDDLLAGIPEGERNDSLFRLACRLRRQLGDGARQAAEVLVLEAAGRCSPPFPAEEARACVEQAWRQDHSAEAEVPGWEWARGLGGGGADGGEEEGAGAGGYAQTDLGNAHRLADGPWGERLLWTAAGGWWVWDGCRWRRDDTLESRRAAHAVAGELAREADRLAESGEAGGAEVQAARRWALASQSSGRVSAVLAEAAALLAASDDDWDADPWLLNCPNGVVDLRSGHIRPHKKEDRVTRLAGSRWVEGAEAGKWRDFVEVVLPDPDVRWFVQKAAGYSLTGSTDAKCLLVLWGPGDNGKSVFLEALRELAYGGYAGTAAKAAVMEGRESHETVVASLAGVRFATLSEEVGARDRLDAGRLKAVTGGDEMTARFIRQDEFTFRAQLKLWLGTNHRPGLTDFGPAMRRRLRLVEFPHRFTADSRRDAEEVRAEFRAEREGVLWWCAEGLKGYLEEGLEAPSAVVDGVEDWLSGDDAVGAFLEERCQVGGGWSRVTELHSAYLAWAGLAGQPAIGRKTFARDLEGRCGGGEGGIERRKGSATAPALYSVVVREVGAYGV